VFFAEPQTTKFDVHFSIGKIPVRVHPLFWLISIAFGVLSVRYSGVNWLVGIGLWTAAVFVSILVHELGHALAAKAHGWPPRIVLYSMGGLAMYTPTRHTRKSRIIISFMGPGAGFILGGIILAAVLVSGHSVPLPGLGFEVGSGPSFVAGSGRLELFVLWMLYVNFFYGLLNLAPIQPLDGGSIAQAIIEKFRPRAQGRHRDRGRDRNRGPGCVAEHLSRAVVRDPRVQQLADAAGSNLNRSQHFSGLGLALAAGDLDPALAAAVVLARAGVLDRELGLVDGADALTAAVVDAEALDLLVGDGLGGLAGGLGRGLVLATAEEQRGGGQGEGGHELLVVGRHGGSRGESPKDEQRLREPHAQTHEQPGLSLRTLARVHGRSPLHRARRRAPHPTL
jgi:stage IV sporulation protein FB